MSIEELLDKWLDKTGDCWLWTGDTWKGYGKTAYKGKKWMAHRLSYTFYVEEIDPTTVIHHKCANRTCCNPDHLQAVSHIDNVAEMMGRTAYKKEIKQLKQENAKLRAAVKKLEKQLNGK
jgi:hypothetical protein